jgi:hypothetical protein
LCEGFSFASLFEGGGTNYTNTLFVLLFSAAVEGKIAPNEPRIAVVFYGFLKVIFTFKIINKKALE